VSILDEFRLTGQVAIVTGASSGLGVAFARALTDAGASVVLTARRADRLDSVAAAIEADGGRAVSVPADVADPDACAGVAAAAIAEFGRVDILVNNAGLGTAFPASRETPAQFRSVVDVNLNGSYWMAQACARLMQPGSSIVNISSVLALTTAGLPQAAYSASKAALLGLTRDLANQWTGRKGIRVNAIAPGFFPTEMTDQYDAGYLDSMRSRMLIPRVGRLEECAATLVWLVSPAAGYVTGQTIVVDGGVSIT
jgi:NAD(P)-dependent dehydrogenase (short-subunit alcohol dehydrogenase family)